MATLIPTVKPAFWKVAGVGDEGGMTTPSPGQSLTPSSLRVYQKIAKIIRLVCGKVMNNFYFSLQK